MRRALITFVALVACEGPPDHTPVADAMFRDETDANADSLDAPSPDVASSDVSAEPIADVASRDATRADTGSVDASVRDVLSSDAFEDRPCDADDCGSCSPGLSRCGGVCVDLSRSMAHCGACENACPASRVCVVGVCVSTCGSTETECATGCRDLQTDRANCGACGNACAAGSACASGACVVCPAGRTLCSFFDGDPCGVDLTRDVSACGSCSRSCVGSATIAPTCREGVCGSACREGLALCGDARCRTLSSDDANCGACGSACVAGALCVDGRCEAVPIRPRSPISTMYVASGRPWLRWDLPSGAEGARVEVCATRSCDRIEGSWDASSDRLRVPVALGAGVHFWRLFARRGGRLDTTPGPTWEFVVPTSAMHPNAFLDVNSDGFEDAVTPEGTVSESRLRVRFGAAPGATPTPAQTLVTGNRGRIQIYYGDLPTTTEERFDLRGPTAAGDINGDGYGDAVASVMHWRLNNQTSTLSSSDSSVILFLGGARGLVPVDGGALRGDAREGTIAANDFVGWAAGDRDGDGFGDVIASMELNLRRDPIRQRFGGRSLTREATASNDISCDPAGSAPSEFLVGDFDADGRSDLIDTRCRFVHSMIYVMPGGPLLSDGVTLPRDRVRCEASDLLGNAVGVLDHDDDGYDDLLVRTGLSFVVVHGSERGLSPERCERLASAP